jgi:type I restriction enzyme M protein
LAGVVGAGLKPAPTMAGSVRAGLKPARTTYSDIRGFCASIPIDRVAELDYVLPPGRYVGLPDEEDDFDFKERFTALKSEFEAQLIEEAELNKAIAENLAKVKL